MPEDKVTIRNELLAHMSVEEVDELEETLKEIAAEHGKDDKKKGTDPQTWTDWEEF